METTFLFWIGWTFNMYSLCLYVFGQNRSGSLLAGLFFATIFYRIIWAKSSFAYSYGSQRRAFSILNFFFVLGVSAKSYIISRGTKELVWKFFSFIEYVLVIFLNIYFHYCATWQFTTCPDAHGQVNLFFLLIPPLFLRLIQITIAYFSYK